MFVLTIDQDRSREGADRVPELLAVLAGLGGPRAATDPGVAAAEFTPGWLLPAERTAGDEVQMVAIDPALVVAAARSALRLGGWQIGIGIGPLNDATARASDTREASGPAFIAAREAVTAAQNKRTNVPFVVRSVDPQAEPARFEAAVQLLGVVYDRRTARSWEYIDATVPAGGHNRIAQWALARSEMVAQTDIARTFGVSAQAVSRHLRRAAWSEELAVLPLLDELAGELVLEKTQGEA
ncbi:hypothetical protein GCM10010401_22460 [Rarobacter faecitabidus]|uniref:SatD family protein n=1 Tax=Rarobacter faecitabidus TaxID=13243 RepID=A0A542ZVQ9_RARFA|nr:hypothetical protein [Rarobacter faecitabidus]TQL64448.1 hypothetical protein FB461_0952 [Rarobacter faecitabidus]